MVAQLASPYSYFTDANGVPLAGGLIYTYAAGTTTPQNSYTDSTGGTPAANPVVLDSAGKATIWLSGSYKIVVKDSLGNAISTTDNITTASSAITSAVDTAFTFVNGSDATKKLAFDLSGITTGTTRTVTIPDKSGTLAMTSDISGAVRCYQVTDSTDISLSQVPTQANVGTTVSISIPTKGYIQLATQVATSASGTGAQGLVFGIRIGSTNYWPTTVVGGSTSYQQVLTAATSGVNSTTSYGGSDPYGLASNSCPGLVGLAIEALSIPTGTQTVQVIAGHTGTGTLTIKGTTTTTRVNISTFNHA